MKARAVKFPVGGIVLRYPDVLQFSKPLALLLQPQSRALPGSLPLFQTVSCLSSFHSSLRLSLFQQFFQFFQHSSAPEGFHSCSGDSGPCGSRRGMPHLPHPLIPSSSGNSYPQNPHFIADPSFQTESPSPAETVEHPAAAEGQQADEQADGRATPSAPAPSS